jgi:DNA-directed RNA polymerase specialized sigma24 family protein
VTIHREDFDRFLHWLDPNRENAAQRYERIRRKLITICAARGGSHPEEMADECIDAVVQKVPEIAPAYTGEPEFYFYSVVKFVVLRWRRRNRVVEVPEGREVTGESVDSRAVEQQHECLDCCLDELDDKSRELVLEYYRHDKQAKIDHRLALAQRNGITTNALRIKALRIRQMLEGCVNQCTDQQVRSV